MAASLDAMEPQDREKAVAENTVPEHSAPANAVEESTVAENTVAENTVPEPSAPANPVEENTVAENTVPEHNAPANTVEENTVPANTVPEHNAPANTVLEPSAPANPVEENTVTEHNVPANPVAENTVPVVENTVAKNAGPEQDLEKAVSEKDTESAVLEKGPASDLKMYETGLKLHMITFSMLLMMFLAQMESTITSTALITITDDLGGYNKSSWLLTAYWLTAGAFQIIWAKISDITGRKPAILIALAIFTIFSGACGGSQTVMQLIMFRWLQGIGGCGILALGQLLFYELVPPSKYPAYIALVTVVLSAALIFGPLIGGGITVHDEWRWVFLLNVPVGFVAMLGLFWIFPRHLSTEPAARRGPLTIHSAGRLDFLGCSLLLGSCLFITTALQQAAIGYDFDSAYVLPLLVLTLPFVVGFLGWQWYVTTRRNKPEPVFPWRFCQRRVRMALILISWTNGAILSTCVVQIPQRFITVNGMTPLTASARFLAFGIFVPAGSAFGSALMSRVKLRPYMVAACAVVLQIIGTVFLSRAHNEVNVQASQYGMQVLVGTGIGMIFPVVMVLIPEEMEKQDVPCASAAQSQFRLLGGVIAVSIGAVVTTRFLEKQLATILPQDIVGRVMQRTETLLQLSGTELSQARHVFGDAYNRQMYVAIALAAIQVPIVAMMATRKKPSILKYDSESDSQKT